MRITGLARTHELSGAGSAAELSEHDVETAAMYVAGWLRRLSDLPIAMLLLDERWTGSGELPPIDTAVYSPVANVAEHYRWILGQRTNDGTNITGSPLHGAPSPRTTGCRRQSQRRPATSSSPTSPPTPCPKRYWLSSRN